MMFLEAILLWMLSNYPVIASHDNAVTTVTSYELNGVD
jgi:hypothetical protein